jgi:hypothetical protein
MKKYKESIHSISKWSEETFPYLTAYMQEKKLKEELEEVARAENTDRWIGEMADVYIVSAILWDRFYNPLGRLGLDWVEMHPEYEKIREAVDAKMVINRARKWHINKNGVYHH